VAAFACVMEKSPRIMHDIFSRLESNNCDMPFWGARSRVPVPDAQGSSRHARERMPGVHLLASEFELTCPTSDEVRLGALLRRAVGATVSGLDGRQRKLETRGHGLPKIRGALLPNPKVDARAVLPSEESMAGIEAALIGTKSFFVSAYTLRHRSTLCGADQAW
jgi:hypothetical protein